MQDRNKHSENGMGKVLGYLKNLLSGRERNAFEKNLQKDPFEAEAMEGLSMLSPEEAERDLLTLSARLNRRLEKRSRFIFYRIAASVAIIAVISTLYFTFSDKQLKEFPGAPEVSEALPEEEKAEEIPATTKEFSENAKSPSETKQPGVSIPEPAGKGKKAESNKLTPEKKPEQEAEAAMVEADDVEDAFEFKEIADAEKEEVMVAQPVQGFEAAAKEKTATRAAEAPAAAPEMDRMAVSRSSAAKKTIVTDPEGTGKEMAITGRVISSEDGLPIPGAGIVITGTTTGTVTDADGKFVLPMDNDQPVDLEANFIGMEPYETTAEKGEELEIVMKPSVLSLSEVVVVGSSSRAGTSKTGAVSEIKDLDNTTQSSFVGAYPKEGYPAFKEYLRKNMVLPDSLAEKTVVVLKFVVLPNGRPSEINVIRSPGEPYSSEAIRLLREGPDWVPAMSDGRYVDVETRMRMRMGSSTTLGDPF